MKAYIKYPIIVIAWILYLAIGASGEDKSGSGTSATSINSQESIINTVVDNFNQSSESKLVFNEDFPVQDKASSHYRTEYRLGGYKDALGKSYYLNDLVVDIISTKDFAGNVNDIRIYADGASLEQCSDLVKYTSAILDPSITQTEIDKAISYINTNKSANGYYYGKLGLLLVKNGENWYNIMIKTG